MRTRRRPGGVVEVTLSGELDIATAAAMRERLCDLAPADALDLDLSGVGFIDLTGLQGLLETTDHLARRGCAVRCIASSRPVQRLLTAFGIGRTLQRA